MAVILGSVPNELMMIWLPEVDSCHTTEENYSLVINALKHIVQISVAGKMSYWKFILETFAY